MDEILQKIGEARAEGYSDKEISDYLSKTDPRFKEAMDEGYSLNEIVGFMSQPPERSFGEQFRTGMGKRAEEIGLALKGVGLRAGSALGITSPEDLAEYQKQVEQTRSLMASMAPGAEGQYRRLTPETGAEVLGGTALDLASLYGAGAALKPVQMGLGMIPRVGPTVERGFEYGRQAITAPRTVPQAALGGGIYAQTIPYKDSGEALTSTALSSGAGALFQPVARAIGLAAQPESQLPTAQREAARRAVEAGFQFTPAQMTGSKTGMFIEEGIKALPLARGAYAKLEDENQTALQKIAAKAIGLKEGVDFTPQAMQDAYMNALNKYKTLESVPAIKLDKGFVDQLANIEKKLAKIPDSQRAQLDIPKIESVIKDYKNFSKNAVDGETMFQSLRALSAQLFSAQKEGSFGAGVYKDLRASFENAIERSLQAPSKKGTVSSDVVSKFKEGRTQMANWFTVDEAFNAATGEISGPKLASSLARKSNFGGRNTELETAALAVRAFPRALPSSGTAERAESARMARQIAQAAAVPVLGAGATGLATQDPYAALAGGAASQILPAIAARVATSEPVRSIVARRQLGAISPDQGMMASLMRGFEEKVPSQVRFGAGDLTRIYAQQAAARGLLD